ncbi:hypothetical protein Q9290_05920 [Oceanimonas sp. CHS3-5]|uniref:hypothetical protein n=1 Tax=Oceanimonas sp. CHS3-5 TaxID=3068186 RepID=UPI00273E67FA|nr:hypothetical protein [Oceanimonas sp. CHS3-5]MDP5291826.1 hypothetical protein [Oceanimonas sp. CHS3-5]
MSPSGAHAMIFNLLQGSELSSQRAYTVARLPSDFDRADEPHIIDALTDMGYTSQSNDYFQDDSGHRSLYISRKSEAWAGFCPLVTDKGNLWKRLVQAATSPEFVFPEYFFIQGEKISSFSEDAQKLKSQMISVFEWKKLLTELCDHPVDSDSFVFFINKDDVGKKYELNTILGIESIESIISPQESLDVVKYLAGKLEDKDAHHDERRSVMRSTLAEFLDGSSSKIFLNIINKSKRFEAKYRELYDLYIRRFSINKVLNELETKSLEYTGKVNELLASGQARALTIPGAVVAVGALYRTASFLNSLLILLAVWLIKELTVTANQVHRETFEFLQSQVESSFKKYLKIDEDEDVKDSARGNLETLIILIGKAKDRLDKIDKWSRWMCWGAVVYMVLVYIFNGK